LEPATRCAAVLQVSRARSVEPIILGTFPVAAFEEFFLLDEQVCSLPNSVMVHGLMERSISRAAKSYVRYRTRLWCALVCQVYYLPGDFVPARRISVGRSGFLGV
jgi:hypothetical protein